MAKKSARQQSAAEVLNDVLPLAEPATGEIHFHAALLQVANPAQLLELAADTALRTLLLCRLDATTALVDPGRAEELVQVLRRRGYTPKVINAR